MNRELQSLEALCNDVYQWIQGLPWTEIGYGSLVLLLLIVFVVSRFVRKEHIDTNHEEGSES